MSDERNDAARRTVLVTGAASGIGAALVERLRGAGTDVVGWDLRAGDRDDVRYIALDLTDAAQITRAAARLPERIDAIANVAGVPGTAPALRVLEVNVLGPQRVIAAVGERLPRGAAIVNVASLAAARNAVDAAGLAALRAAQTNDDLAAWLQRHPLEGPAAYDTSKRVLVDASALASARLAERGIRVVSVSPGPIQTPILGDFVTSMGKDAIDRSAAAVGRHGTAAEIAAVVAFVLSPDASWLNGVDILVDGGLSGLRAAGTLAAHSEGEPS